jgi:prolyl-tRNA editing enzyme YbaK/EbsC (Cys-tRNA(Pro) deacylase)
MDNNTTNTLSASALIIQNILDNMGYDCKVIEFIESTRTSAEAADRVGCQIGQIIKSLIFRGYVSGKPVLVLTSGANRVDEIIIGQYAGETIRRADAGFVRTKTGFTIGGVPPVGHILPLETYIDEDLFQYGQIWGAAGTPNAVFATTPADLEKMTGGKVIKVKT